MIYLSVFAILLILAVIVFLLNEWLKIYINPNTYPNNIWYRENLQRNYKYIVLGNGVARELFPVDWRKGEGFNLALRNQSLRRDFEVLKQNFSILKENGYAVFVLTKDALYRTEDVKDKRPYIYTLYSHTLSLSHFAQIYKKTCKYYPILMFRPIDIFYWILHVLGKNEQTYFDTKLLMTYGKINNVNLHEYINLVLEIKSFCENRGINVIFAILDIKNLSKSDSCETLSLMSSLHNKLNVKSYKISADLRKSYNIQDILSELR